MRIRRFVVMALAGAVYAALSPVTAAERWHPNVPYGNRMKTAAFTGEGGNRSPYALALHNLILAELRQTDIPFVTVTEPTVTVWFALDRRGRIVKLGLAQASGSAVLDGLLQQVVRRASGSFAPPPPDLAPYFSIPITFR